MKVLLINGSPNEFGCTYTALNEARKVFEQNGIETRKILRTKKEKDAWLKEARAKHADGFRASVFINDETIKRGFKPWL